DASPYRGVVTHGWTLDEQGRPMSKSLGNTLYPIEICERWGADLLRLWVASVEYQADVKMSERVMTQLSEAYRKIRNTFRFALGNLNDFDSSRDALANDQLEEIWTYLPKAQGEPESVHMALFPEADSLACGIARDAVEKWARLAQVRSAVLVALEQARAAKTIGGGLEAKVRLHAAREAADLQ